MLLLIVLLGLAAYGAEVKIILAAGMPGHRPEKQHRPGDQGRASGTPGRIAQQAKEKFLPALAFQLGKAKTNTPSYSWIEAEGAISAESQQLSGQLTQALWLGGSVALEVDTSQYESNQRFQTINPRYEGAVTFKLVQPLLRDMGDRISRKSIIIAGNNRTISANELKTALLDTVYRVEELYWNLVFAERNLEAKSTSLKLAEDLLNKNTKMAELGVIAEIEILSAEAETASRAR